MPIKKRGGWVYEKSGKPVKEGHYVAEDGVCYTIVALLGKGTPAHPYPHMKIVRSDASNMGIPTRVDPKDYGVTYR